MTLLRHALPLLLAAATLHAGDMDLYLIGSNLSPRSEAREGTLDPATGDRLGKTIIRGGDARQVGLGAAFTLLSPGDWRVKAGVEYTIGASDTDLSLRYLRFQGFSEYSAATDGKVSTRALTPLLSLVYVSSGAGEYGISYEHHFTNLDYKVSRNVVVNGSTVPPNAARTLSKSVGDPFLSVHATFVQRYRSLGFFARVSYGVNLASIRKLHDLTEADFLSTSSALLDLARPKQEVKLAIGTRF